MDSCHEIRGALEISLIFSVIIAFSEIMVWKFNPPPEFTRKFVHVAGGIACLFFPFFVSSHFTVLALAITFSALFFIGARLNFLKSLHKVGRKTMGSEYYPFSIWILFLISADFLWLYFSSVLVLTVADACAALVGEKYGSIRYRAGDSFKSLEGSIFFWIIAFNAILIPMLLLSGLPKETCLLSAVLVSFLVTCVEAISTRGTDNVFVPVLTAYILLKITQKPVPEIAFQCASLFAIFAVFGLIIWRSRLLDVGAGIIFLGISYASWSLGSFLWAMPVFAAFLFFAVARYLMNKIKYQPKIGARTLFSALAVPFSILVFANSFDIYQKFFGLYLVAYVMTTAFAVWNAALLVLENGRKTLSLRIVGSAISALLSWLLICVPIWFLHRAVPLSAPFGTLAVAVFLMTSYECLSKRKKLEGEPIWTDGRFLATLSSAGILWILQHTHMIAIWNLK